MCNATQTGAIEMLGYMTSENPRHHLAVGERCSEHVRQKCFIRQQREAKAFAIQCNLDKLQVIFIEIEISSVKYLY